MTVARAETGAPRDWPGAPRAWFLIATAGVAALHPVLANGFLAVAFDDNGFVLDNPYLQATWGNVVSIWSTPYMHDYVPLALLSYMADFSLWGMWPAGYHLTNLLLHVATAVGVWAICRHVFGDGLGALFAGCVFVLHPVQVEAVSLVAQRKTLLATLGAVVSLLSYQRATSRGSRAWYAGSVVAFASACLAKASVVPFPLLLWLYDDAVQPAKRSWKRLIPFFIIAAVATLVSTLPKADVAIKAPHGGSRLVTALWMSRVLWEYALSIVLPVGLAPSYYYSAADSYSWTNWAAAALLLTLLPLAWWSRRARPFLVFSVMWTLAALLPVLNIIPIAVLRSDRFLYLPMVGVAIGCAAGLTSLRRSYPQATVLLPALLGVTLLGTGAWWHSFVYRDDVSAWLRTADRHPDSAYASYYVGLAYLQSQRPVAAENWANRSSRLDPNFLGPYDLRASIDRSRGDENAAEREEAKIESLKNAASQLPSVPEK